MINPGDTILFQGDSITDVGRSREDAAANSSGALGRGYPLLVASQLLHEQAEDDLEFYNRGNSGNRVVDLYARWKVDAINLAPDLISILIGVNDTWHEFGSRNGVGVERYETIYRMLLEYTKQRLPAVKLVLCEPFVFQHGAVSKEWLPEIEGRRAVVRKLADEFKACFVPFQTALNQALDKAEPTYWTADGVHPTAAGHNVLKDAWLKAVLNG